MGVLIPKPKRSSRGRLSVFACFVESKSIHEKEFRTNGLGYLLFRFLITDADFDEEFDNAEDENLAHTHPAVSMFSGPDSWTTCPLRVSLLS